LKSGDSNLTNSIFRELSAHEFLDQVSEKNLYTLAYGLEKSGSYQDAVSLFILYANRYPGGRAREKALYRSYVILRDSIRNDIQAHKALAYLTREYPDTLLTRRQAQAAREAAEGTSGIQVPSQAQAVEELFIPA
jgi:outer membrane protein assembly factor BamD (BamD/ComL family)